MLHCFFSLSSFFFFFFLVSFACVCVCLNFFLIRCCYGIIHSMLSISNMHCTSSNTNIQNCFQFSIVEWLQCLRLCSYVQHNPFTISRERLYFAFSHFNVRFILYMRLIAFATVYFFTSPKLSDFKWKILSLSVSFSLSLSLACIVCHPTLHECMFIIQIIILYLILNTVFFV